MENATAAGGRYSLGAIAFHWAIAVLISLNFAAAWVADDAPRLQAQQIMANHKAIGIAVLVLSLLRLLWRVLHKAPPLPETLRPLEAALAKVVHWLFYVLMIALPLAGWAMHLTETGGMPVHWFGLFDIPGLPVAKDERLGDIFSDMHEFLANLMLVLAAIHVAASLKHIFLDRDGTMRRMLPWG